MGDFADGMFESAFRQHMLELDMAMAGARRCKCRTDPLVFEAIGDGECPTCHDTGWLDANGNPCEP